MHVTVACVLGALKGSRWQHNTALGCSAVLIKTSARAINLIHTRNNIDNWFMYTRVALFWTHTNENTIEKKRANKDIDRNIFFEHDEGSNKALKATKQQDSRLRY